MALLWLVVYRAEMQQPLKKKSKSFSSWAAETFEKEDIVHYLLGFLSTIDQLSVGALTKNTNNYYKSFIKPVNPFAYRLYIRESYLGLKQVQLVKPCVVPDISSPVLDATLDIRDLLERVCHRVVPGLFRRLRTIRGTCPNIFGSTPLPL